MEHQYILVNQDIENLFEFLRNSNKLGVRKDSGVTYELLRDLRGTLDTFLGPDGFGK